MVTITGSFTLNTMTHASVHLAVNFLPSSDSDYPNILILVVDGFLGAQIHASPCIAIEDYLRHRSQPNTHCKYVKIR